jgi:NAD(P)-dependent dehydrogenase (short-subunit alcohol dehydrogenase family)
MSQVWLLTGSSRGLGRELAKAVLAAGHRLVGTACRSEDLGELVSQYGDLVRAVSLDVTDPTAARAAVAAALSVSTDVDGLVDFSETPMAKMLVAHGG